MNLKDETSKNLGKKSSKGKKNVSFEYGATKSIWREFGVSKIFRETEYTTQCGFLQKFTLTHYFGKTFVKATVLLKKLLNSWFDEIFFRWE